MDLQESTLEIAINQLHRRVTLKMFIILKENIFATLFLYLLFLVAKC